VALEAAIAMRPPAGREHGADRPTSKLTGRPTRNQGIEARLIREEAIRRGARRYWPGCDPGWPDWCVLGDRVSAYTCFDSDQDAVHAGLIEAVADWRRESRIDTVDLETVLPYLAPTSPGAEVFLLPDRPAAPIETSPTDAAPLQLDPDLLDRIEADTALAAASLRGTFSLEPSPTPQRTAQQPPTHSQGSLVPGVAGLDLAHRRVLSALATRLSWTAAEVTALCGEQGLRLAGAFEVLNDGAYDLCGRPLLEPSDDPDPNQPLAINHDVLQELLQ